MSSEYNVTGYPTTNGTSTVLFKQRLCVSFIQKLVTVYQTKSTTPKEFCFVICLLCIVGGKNGAPPSVNTMQFFYRLLESQKVQNKRLNPLAPEFSSKF
jgi:hypothetical protein